MKQHKMSKTQTWSSWRAMIKRCYQPTTADFSEYGGRGVKVCKRWQSFVSFFEDMGERPAGTTINRKNTNGDYEPENCNWATPKEQARNKRNNSIQTAFGVTACLTELCEIHGTTYNRVKARLRGGWKLEDALAVPSVKRFTPEEIQEIKKLAESETQLSISKRFGVTPGAIHHVVHR